MWLYSSVEYEAMAATCVRRAATLLQFESACQGSGWPEQRSPVEMRDSSRTLDEFRVQVVARITVLSCVAHSVAGGQAGVGICGIRAASSESEVAHFDVSSAGGYSECWSHVVFALIAVVRVFVAAERVCASASCVSISWRIA